MSEEISDEEIERLLEVKKEMKDKKPGFTRQNVNKRNRLDEKWRAPTGNHSSVRKEEKGHKAKVKTGYGTPKKVRDMNEDGKIPKRVFNTSDLEDLNPDKHVAVLASSVGMRKRTNIVEEAKEKDISVENIEGHDDYLSSVEEEMEKRKEEREEKEAEKEEEKQEKEEQDLEEDDTEDEESEDTTEETTEDEEEEAEDEEDEEDDEEDGKSEAEKVITKKQ